MPFHIPLYTYHDFVAHTATVVGDFMIILARQFGVRNTSSVYVYSLKNSIWYQADCTCLDSFNRSDHTTMHVGNGRLLVMGGNSLYEEKRYVIIETGIREKCDHSHIFRRVLSKLQKRRTLTDCEIILMN